MRRGMRIGISVLGVLAAAGCRTATKIAEVPRVDLELSSGNRGYLVGTPPPPSAEMNTTRKMMWTDVELPSTFQPKHGAAPAGPNEPEAPGSVAEMTAAAPSGGTEAAPVHYDTYVVQKGDTLSTIAAKPEIYGKGSRWRRIYDANRELLKNPDQVRTGMTLNIPRGGERAERRHHRARNKGVVYTK